ncbi:MAG: 4-hydroxy-tetrahydrodipicolinate synthase, partial [Clostridiales bacterium]|nr:4-hydroxy-tetrahydrodipicolinate synthase [Clostridiales bacterium]
SIVALVTPFNEDKTINFKKLDDLCQWHVDNKTDAILVLGTTGESSTMSHEEDDAVCEYVIKNFKGKIPIIVGTGSNSTETACEKSIRAEKLGADAVLLISPYYNKANTEGMYRHFADVAQKINIPIILYNVPSRTGCTIPVSVVERLSKIDNIVGIKEASGDLGYAMKISRFLSDDFLMWSGNDDIVIPMLSIGATGVISVWANVMPHEVSSMVSLFHNGKKEEALKIQLDNLDLINALFIEVNPIPVKEAMNLMGFEVGGYRLPLWEMNEDNKAKLKAVMEKAGLVK